ncbi:MAG: deoxyribonuclease V [Acidobacteriota bacterium]
MSPSASSRFPGGIDHRWDLTPKEARDLQSELRSRVELVDRLPEPIERVAGLDIGFEDGNTVTRAAVVVLRFADLTVLEHVLIRRPTTFPYVPGLLSFRELPAALEAFAELERLPDLVLCDGHGYAHPRRMGLACHLGLATGLATIGVAKSRFIGHHDEVGEERGETTALIDDDEHIGVVLRTRNRVKPVYVSIGHRVSLPTAVALTLACTPRWRLPETTRTAHKLASHGIVPGVSGHS